MLATVNVICAPEAEAVPPTIETEIEKFLTRDPDAGPTLVALKVHFPDTYEGIKRRMLQAIAQGGSPEQGRSIGRNAIRGFVQANRRNMAVAPTPHLVAYAEAQKNLFEVMHRDDVGLCARYAMEVTTPSKYVPPAVRTATAAISVTMIKAARHGIDVPVQRSFQTISDADARAYAVEVRKQGVPLSALTLMADEHALALASPEQQCMAGLINARTIARLPPEAVARWIAFMLTQ